MTDLAYVAINPCGCVSAIVRAGFVPRHVVRRELEQWVSSGRRVDVVPFADAKAQLQERCPHMPLQDEDAISRLLDEAEHAPSENRPPRPYVEPDGIGRIAAAARISRWTERPTIALAIRMLQSDHPQRVGRINGLAVAGAVIAVEIDALLEMQRAAA